MDKPWYVYIVRCSDRSLYTGVTTDIQRRVHEHNHSSRGAKYTRARRPVELMWSKEYPDRSSAQSAEYSFKKLTHKQKIDIVSTVIN